MLTRTRRAVSIFIFTVVVVVAAAVVVTAQQTRDAPGVQKSASFGTAVLTGTLLTDTDTPQPVRRATVRLAGAKGTMVRLTGTDD